MASQQLSPDISLTRLPQAEDLLQDYLGVSTVKIKNTLDSKGVAVEVQLNAGEDLDDAEFDDLTSSITKDIKDFLIKKFNAKTARIFIENIDTGDHNTVIVSSVKTKKSVASVGESRDELVEVLVRARNSLLEATDALRDARILAEKDVSKKVAENIQTKLIDILDNDSSSLVNTLKDLLRTLSSTTLTYND